MSDFDEIFIKEMSPLDAYNYGRQMMEKELNEIHLCECNQIRAEAYQQGKLDGARDFAEVIKSQSSEMVQAFIDRQLAEWQKGAENVR